MPVIRRLSTSVINKIAAGEVIERPASVVKELLENALDSGAKRIDVTVEQGGIELIRIVDDGCGMAAEQLPLAIAPHATSKLESADDLFRVATLGFRGEALASIAEISRTTIRSRERNAAEGAEMIVDGGVAGEIQPCGSPPGTTIAVQQLFFNTPVRRKFLRSTSTEMGHIVESFTRAALAFPEIHFTLRHGPKLLHDLPPTNEPSERIGAFFGEELARDLLWVESRDEHVWLRGYVAKPNQNRANNKLQYLFLNGRAIRDRSLQHALSEAYRGIMMVGRFPIAFLRVDMPPDAVDVNVHPTKMEVRFQDGGRLYSQLLGTLRAKFLSSDLNAKLAPVVPQAANGGGLTFKAPAVNGMLPWDRDAARQAVGAAQSPQAPLAVASNGATFYSAEVAHDVSGADDPDRAERMRSELVAWAKGQLGAQAPGDRDSTGTPIAEHDFAPHPALPDWVEPSDDDVPTHGHAPLPLVHFARPGTIPPPPAYPGVGAGIPNSIAPTPLTPTNTFGGTRSSAIQIHNRYLVAETSEGLAVIDQHALHERILYEQIRTKVLAGAVESQRLLVPEPVELSATEATSILARQDLLQRLGIEIESFGGGTVLVSSYPAMLAKFRPADVIRELVEQLRNEGKTPERRDLLDELMHMMSCKAAIKAGDPLTPEEVDALIAQRDLYQDSHHCPHGRPTALTLTRDELDKQFKRI